MTDRPDATADGAAPKPPSSSGDGATAQAASTATQKVFISWAHKANLPADCSADASNSTAEVADGAGSTDGEADERQRSADQAWVGQILQLATALWQLEGIDADADLFHSSDRTINWLQWGPQQVQAAETVLAVVNTAWRERFEGSNRPTEGAGAAAEALVLQALWAEDQAAGTQRVLIVLLPGITVQDIPLAFRGIPHAPVSGFDAAGMAALVGLLTGVERYPRPSSIPRSAIPPRVVSATHAVTASLSTTSTLSATGTTHSGGSAAGTVVSSGSASGHAVEGPSGNDAPAPSPSPAGQRLLVGALLEAVRSVVAPDEEESTQARLVEELLAAALRLDQVATPASVGPSAASSSAQGQATARLSQHGERLAARLERDSRCWLMLASAPVSSLTGGDARAGGTSGAEPRERAERLLRTFSEAGWLPVGLPGAETGHRLGTRVVFPGAPTPMSSATTASATWRAELADDGGGALAASICAPVRDHDGDGLLIWRGEDRSSQDPVGLALQLHQDRLEMWLLVQLEVLAAHARTTAGLPFTIGRDRTGAAAEGGAVRTEPNSLDVSGPDGQGSDQHLVLRADLLLPASLVSSAAPDAPVVGVRVMRETRDAAGHRLVDYPAPRSTPLPLDGEEVVTAARVVGLDQLGDAPTLVRTARSLALQLLAHAGVEETLVLTDGGHLDEMAAGEGEQQHLYQHAQALGLPVGYLSPHARRDRYNALVAQAEDLYRR